MSEYSFAADGIADGIIEGQAPDRSPVETQYSHQARITKRGKPQYNSSFKFSEVFSGFKMTVNGLTALFFIGYALWLVVLYFIRHNEPLANQVIGTPNAGAPTSDVDRLIVGGAKNALPINATGSKGFYTPGAKAAAEARANALPAMGDPHNFSTQSQMAFSQGQAPQQTITAEGSAAYGLQPQHSKIVHYGRERVIIHHPEPLPGDLQAQAPQQPNQYMPPAAVPMQNAFGTPAPQAYGMAPQQYSAMPATGGQYNLPVQTTEGLKLRTVVNR